MAFETTMNSLGPSELIKRIEERQGYEPTTWEKAFMRRIKSDLKKGFGVSTKENILLHGIYRKSLHNFNYAVPDNGNKFTP